MTAASRRRHRGGLQALRPGRGAADSKRGTYNPADRANVILPFIQSLRGPGGAAATSLFPPVRMRNKGPARLLRRLPPPRNDVLCITLSSLRGAGARGGGPAAISLFRPVRMRNNGPARLRRRPRIAADNACSEAGGLDGLCQAHGLFCFYRRHSPSAAGAELWLSGPRPSRSVGNRPCRSRCVGCRASRPRQSRRFSLSGCGTVNQRH